ncbi:signal peptide peptidase SppA [Caulobacter sp. NIBR2454]|uniref:signal peptide peptidase SppA n=1 Tax=Caulobacter sp. NIBR2454 TaxID=3015996 RepID=UPI0022B6E0FB|nr:signal peptide peptidase SppA [Caulobacter sp. NIBR2454]
MKQFLLTVAGVFVGLALFLIGIPFLLIVLAAGAAAPPATPTHAVVSLDLRQGMSDQDSMTALAVLGGRPSVISTIETLRRAERDDKVEGLFVRLPEGGMTPAAADELRGAFKRLRAAGKSVIVHSQGLYPSGIVTSTYMVGASADELWMQPGAPFQATGIFAEDVFLKRLFDKYGVKAEFAQRSEYKTAINPYLYDDYTPAHRESQLGWMTSVYESALTAVAADRKKDVAVLRRTIEAGPYMAADALTLGLIDKVGQVKEAEAQALKRAGKGAVLVEFDDYAARARRNAPTLGGSAIAVIGAEGPIMTGTGDRGSPFSTDQVIYSDDVAKAFYQAIADDEVKAIVFRVSSPGGSSTASEQILAAVRAAKAAGKPVVVSMGAYAASGGYWIASEASSIVSQPSTLTGSIGVYGGKFAVGEGLARFGVDARELTVGGEYAGTNAMGEAWSPAQRAGYERWISGTYSDFIERVSRGRKLPADRVAEIAKGRVWTGAQAKDLGLVDQIGGFYDAVEQAKTLAKLKGDVRLKRVGGPKSAFEALERAFGVSADSARAVAAAGWLLGDPRAEAVMDQMLDARLRGQGATVLAPRMVD